MYVLYVRVRARVCVLASRHVRNFLAGQWHVGEGRANICSVYSNNRCSLILWHFNENNFNDTFTFQE